MPENKKTKKFISDSPKLNFFLGLILGFAILGGVGFVTLLSDKNDSTEKNNNQQVAGEEENVQPVNIEITTDDHIIGDKNAPIQIVEFSDFQCPYCAMFHETMHQIVEDYPNQVAWVYKQFPIASHPLGMPGALATECAAEQDKFWDMADMIFNNQDTLTADSFAEFAEELGLDVEQFNACITDEKYMGKITADYNLGIDAGVNGTPTNFINGNMLPGAVPYENMKDIVEELLNR